MFFKKKGKNVKEQLGELGIKVDELAPLKSNKMPPPISELLEKYDREREVLENNPNTTDINVIELSFLANGLDFIDWAKANFKVELTLAERDIDIVEHMAERAHMAYTSGQLTEEGLPEFAKTFAGYVGLLVLIHKGGNWVKETKAFEGLGPAIEQNSGKAHFVYSRAFHRIKEGSEHNLVHYYKAIDYSE